MKYRIVEECPFCGSNGPWEEGIRAIAPHHEVYERGETIYNFCTCGGAFQNPVPTDSSLAEFYRKEYRTVHPEEINPATRLIRAKRVHQYLPQNTGDMLDVGCSSGAWMGFVKDLGWRVAGVEPDDIGRKYSREFGPVYRNLEEVEGTFDLVTAIHVLEHIPKPVPFLQQMARVMRSDGEMLVVVPKDGISAPHVLAMGEPQMRLLCERAGLTITFLEIDATGENKFDIIVKARTR